MRTDGDLENGMVSDAYWRHLEQEVKSFGECAGCQEDIVDGEDYYEIRAYNGALVEVLKVHQNPECCQQYVAEMSWCCTAGEDDA